MKIKTGTKFALTCFAAGIFTAGTPILAAYILGSKAKKEEAAQTKSEAEAVQEPRILTNIGSSLTDSDGAELSLRGINISEFSVSCRKNGKAFSGSCRETFKSLEDRFGSYGAREVYGRYLECSVSEKDLKILKKAGINCIRIPVRNFLTEKYGKKGKAELVPQHLDKISELCGKAGIKVILSVLSAEGYDFEAKDNPLLSGSNEKAAEKFISFWSSLSDHFKDNDNIAAYELLCIGSDSAFASAYNSLCLRTAKEIRASGDKHIIIIDNPLIENADEMVSSGCTAGITADCRESDDMLKERIDAFREKNIPSVILSEKISFESFGKDSAENSVCGIFKGSDLNCCMYCKAKEIIDIGRDKFDDINKALEKSLETKTYIKM